METMLLSYHYSLRKLNDEKNLLVEIAMESRICSALVVK